MYTETKDIEGKKMVDIQVRRVTNKLLEAVDEGILTYEQIAEAALKYMSEDDVVDMAHKNELNYFDDPDDEDEEPEETLLFHVMGDKGLDSETSLYETNYYAEAAQWVKNYLGAGDQDAFGGYETIEVGYHADNGDWICFDFYNRNGFEDHA